MLDKWVVQRIANELELSELVVFIQDAKRHEYVALLRAFTQWLEQRSTAVA
jgi:predicted PhzF superfamily epimerase YddE/YHI9